MLYMGCRTPEDGQSRQWNPVNAGLAALRVSSLSPNATGLMAGTLDDGAFYSTDQGGHGNR
jgi:hypothetical protein